MAGARSPLEVPLIPGSHTLSAPWVLKSVKGLHVPSWQDDDLLDPGSLVYCVSGPSYTDVLRCPNKRASYCAIQATDALAPHDRAELGAGGRQLQATFQGDITL